MFSLEAGAPERWETWTIMGTAVGWKGEIWMFAATWGSEEWSMFNPGILDQKLWNSCWPETELMGAVRCCCGYVWDRKWGKMDQGLMGQDG
jgi:hypothetical protein